MCNSGVHRPFSGVVDPFSFSTFHFLRTCNRLMLPTDLGPYYGLSKDGRGIENSIENNNPPSINFEKADANNCSEHTTIFNGPFTKDASQTSNSLADVSCSTSPLASINPSIEYPLTASNRLPSLNYATLMHRRQRGEKRPIPDEQKDEKYYERRKRNNEAAKKSRDARKMREDRIAFRAAILEQENAILRAQVVALREEMATLRQIMNTRPPQLSVNI